MAETDEATVKIGSAEAFGLARFTERVAADIGLRGPLSEAELRRELEAMEGITAPILAKLAANGVDNVEDVAGCATDDLTGWTERNVLGEVETEHPGFLDGLGVSREDCDRLIIRARTVAGWIADDPPIGDDVTIKLGSLEAFGMACLTQEAAAEMGLRGPLSDAERCRAREDS